MFGKLGDMYQLQKKAKEIKKQLGSIYVEAESKGVKVVVSAEQKVIDIQFQDTSVLQDPKKLSEIIIDCSNRAMEKAQKIAAEKMKDVMGGMGLPGM